LAALWCCVTPERATKTDMMMRALSAGWPDARMIHGAPPDSWEPFAVWGQEWLTLRVVPRAHQMRRPYYHLDNGYYAPARGTAYGYYRICYRGLSPILMREPDSSRERIGQPMRPWRQSGRHVLLAIPGRHFGLALNYDIDRWIAGAEAAVRAHTDRPIMVRSRDSKVAVGNDLHDCWAMVTHSSNVATEAVCHGVPVFVAKTCPAAPVGNLDLKDLECPRMPDRAQWWASLMSQQFTLEEMRNGTAFSLLGRVREQVDG
jgi:hypothetical protein